MSYDPFEDEYYVDPEWDVAKEGYNLTTDSEAWSLNGFWKPQEKEAAAIQRRTEWKAEKEDERLARRGSSHANSKLSFEDVDIIKDMLADGMSNKDIAEVMEISPTVISEIKTGKRQTGTR